MAAPIHCDAAGELHLATVLWHRIETGEITAWCDADLVAVCRAIVDAADAAEIEATDAAALAALGDSGAPEPVHGGGPGDDLGPKAADPGAPPPFPTSGDSSDAGTPPAEPPTAPDSAPPPTEPPVGATRTRTTRQGPNLAAQGGPSEAGSAPR